MAGSVTDAPDPREIGDLEQAIDRFNMERTGILDARYLSIFLRFPDGTLRAGLHGHSWGGCCEIKLLWVAEQARGQGLGSGLLLAAEEEARRRGCRQILLATHSFQAPAFYRRHGFVEVAAIRDYPVGHSEIVMVKLLDDSR